MESSFTGRKQLWIVYGCEIGRKDWSFRAMGENSYLAYIVCCSRCGLNFFLFLPSPVIFIHHDILSVMHAGIILHMYGD